MRYTLGQAARRLQAVTGSYGITDVKDAINRAIESLSGMASWDCLRQTVRFTSVGPCFSLPQGAAGLVRVCLDGHPATVRGRDFRFIHSGPGDLTVIPTGFVAIKPGNVLDLGDSPVMVEPPTPFRIFACSAGTDSAPALKLSGVTVSGTVTDVVIPVVSAPVYSGTTVVSGQKPDDVTADSTAIYSSITSVILDPGADDYTTLYAEDVETLDRYPIAVYHPSISAPRFRRYSIPGVGPDQPVEILAEARIDPMPLIKDSDPLPFDGIDPIEWMIRADWCMRSNEVDAAQKYMTQAANWMKAKEIVNDTIQTSVIINSVYDNSIGEVSTDAFNI